MIKSSEGQAPPQIGRDEFRVDFGSSFNDPRLDRVRVSVNRVETVAWDNHVDGRKAFVEKKKRIDIFLFKAATCATLLLLSSAGHAEPTHRCSAAAAEQARKLLAFHFGEESRVEIDKSVKELAPIRNPADKQQMLDVLEVWGYIYKSQYRMRFIYARVPGECALMGQEILEYSSL